MKSDASPKHFHLRNDKADLKASKQIFTSTCHNLTPVNSECVREKKARVHFRKTTKLNSFSFCCAIYSTNVQIERTRKDSPRVYICCRTEIKASLALSQRTNCLRKFRY